MILQGLYVGFVCYQRLYPRLVICLYYNGTDTAAAVFSINIVLHPAVAQFVIRLNIDI